MIMESDVLTEGSDFAALGSFVIGNFDPSECSG